jgi:hypothetical protein
VPHTAFPRVNDAAGFAARIVDPAFASLNAWHEHAAAARAE